MTDNNISRINVFLYAGFKSINPILDTASIVRQLLIPDWAAVRNVGTTPHLYCAAANTAFYQSGSKLGGVYMRNQLVERSSADCYEEETACCHTKLPAAKLAHRFASACKRASCSYKQYNAPTGTESVKNGQTNDN